MKEVIEKAMKGGFDFKKQLFQYTLSEINILSWYFLNYDTSPSSKGELKISSTQPDMLHVCIDYFSIHELIFGTNLIECLVGEYKGCQNKECSVYSEKDAWYVANNCGSIDKDSQHLATHVCPGFKGAKPADYHRAQMANMKDVEKLKEYVKKLI